MAAVCAARAGEIVMKNGDRITGEIVKKDGKSITVKSANFGVITAPWSEVASVSSAEPVTVELASGKSVKGPVATTGGQIEVGGVAAPPAEVAAIRNTAEQAEYERLLRPGLWDLWSGGGSLGWAGANGNARTLTFTTAATASRATRNDKTSLYFNLIKASATVNRENQQTAHAVRGGWSYDHNVSPRLYVGVFNDYEFDKFQSLDLRFVAGGGAGWHAWKRNRGALDLSGGGNYNRSKFSSGLTRSQAEAYGSSEFRYQLNGAVTLAHNFRIFNNLSDTGSYRVNTDLSVSAKLRKWLTWNVALSDRYLSNPLPGRKANDWFYTTGVGVRFGR